MPNKGTEILSRMNRIPIWAFPGFFIVIIGLGYFFTFFDITNIGFAMPAIASQFDLTGSESLFVALAVGLIGYIVGSYVIGRLADRYGRFNTMLLTMILIAIGSFGDAAATLPPRAQPQVTRLVVRPKGDCPTPSELPPVLRTGWLRWFAGAP